jgi:hypothetical protein
MSFRAIAGLALLVIIAFAPAGGNFSPFVAIENTLSRIGTPVTEREQGELNFLSCVEGVTKAIPDRRNTQIVGNSDSYLVQRSEDLMYPRVRLVREQAEFLFHIGNELPPTGDVVNQADCGGVVFTVVLNG